MSQRATKRVAAATAIAAALILLPDTAWATDQNSTCESGEVCLFDGTNYSYDIFDSYGWIYNYTQYHFLKAGGGGATVSAGLNDGAASGYNFDLHYSVRMYKDINLSPSTDIQSFLPYSQCSVPGGLYGTCWYSSKMYSDRSSHDWYYYA